MTLQECSGKQVMLKVSFLDSPKAAKLISPEDHGIWIEALEISSAIMRTLTGVAHQPVPAKDQILNKFPKMFVPFGQIEWMAAS